MMILAMRHGEWFLAAFAPYIQGCNLSISHKPRHETEQFRRWHGEIHLWSHAPIEGTTFFPIIRYRGMRVWPDGWKNDSTEPILRVHSGYGAEDFPTKTEHEFNEFRDSLIAEGWKWDAREGGEGFVHVDNLEKIEGPPPAGAF